MIAYYAVLILMYYETVRCIAQNAIFEIYICICMNLVRNQVPAVFQKMSPVVTASMVNELH